MVTGGHNRFQSRGQSPPLCLPVPREYEADGRLVPLVETTASSTLFVPCVTIVIGTSVSSVSGRWEINGGLHGNGVCVAEIGGIKSDGDIMNNQRLEVRRLSIDLAVVRYQSCVRRVGRRTRCIGIIGRMDPQPRIPIDTDAPGEDSVATCLNNLIGCSASR